MYQRIVVGTDGSDTATMAVRHALHLAGSCGADLHLVTAWSKMPGLAYATAGLSPTSLATDDGYWVTELHEAFEEQARAAGITAYSHRIEDGPVQALLGVAARVGADLLVVGNCGMTGFRGKLGSIPNTVAHKAPCAVLIVPTT